MNLKRTNSMISTSGMSYKTGGELNENSKYGR